MNKVLILIPTLDKIDARVATIARELSRKKEVDYLPIIGRPIDVQRNNAVRFFLSRNEYTHLFFLDSDVEPPLDSLSKLLMLNVRLASGIYPLLTKEGIFWDIAEREPDTCKGRGEYKYRLTRKLKSKTIPFEADSAGVGCLLIHRDVFDIISWPWFKTLEWEDGSIMTEDTYFFEQANNAGIKLFIDPTVICAHYKNINLTNLMRS